jgi:hypothetical protein
MAEQELCASEDEDEDEDEDEEEMHMLAQIAKAHQELSNWQHRRAGRHQEIQADPIRSAGAMWARVTEEADLSSWQAKRNLRAWGDAASCPQFELPTLETLLTGAI